MSKEIPDHPETPDYPVAWQPVINRRGQYVNEPTSVFINNQRYV